LSEIAKIYSEAFKLAYSGYTYRELRHIHKEYNSTIDSNAIYDARKFLKAVLKTHNYPKKLKPSILLRRKDFKINGNKISIIYKPKERLILGVYPSDKQLMLMLQAKMKGARLVERDGRYFLNTILEKEFLLSNKNRKTIIGIDIGINYIAVCSALLKDRTFTNPIFFKGGEWKHICDRKRKTTRAKEYKRLTRRQHEILHTISKKIIEYAKQFPEPLIVLEKLGHFKNNSWNKYWNFLLSNWARKKLQQMIEYKALWEGIPIVYVNPAYTSLTCHYCGSRGKREGLTFKCSKCGRQYNADANASMNLAKRLRQLLDEPKAMTGERSQANLRSVWEGETHLPPQTQIRLGNGKQMNRMMVTRTVSLPLGLGGA
jgi:putative transposase